MIFTKYPRTPDIHQANTLIFLMKNKGSNWWSNFLCLHIYLEDGAQATEHGVHDF